MKLVQVTIPKNQCSKVLLLLQGLEQEMKSSSFANIVQMEATNCSILQCRVEDEDILSVQTFLQRIGVGVRFGFCDILELTTGTTVGQIKRNPTNKTMKVAKSFFKPKTAVLTTQLYKTIEANSFFTMDSVLLLVISSVTAGIGLATDNKVYVVASMLMSPLMGPLEAASFGLAIFDKDLYLRGIKNEIIALVVTVLIGCLIGIAFAPYATVLIWPTGEMATRGVHIELLFSGIVAIAGGAAAAISECNANISSIVGIAIAASILPPAVNCGMCLSYGWIGPLLMANPDDAQAETFFDISWGSFVLLLVNIFFIYSAAAMVFFSRASLDRFNYKRHDNERLSVGLHLSETRESERNGSDRNSSVYHVRGDDSDIYTMNLRNSSAHESVDDDSDIYTMNVTSLT